MVSILKLVFELQLLFGVAVTKEFTDDLCLVNMPPSSSTDYTLGGGEIHGKQVKLSFNFVHPCIGDVTDSYLYHG